MSFPICFWEMVYGLDRSQPYENLMICGGGIFAEGKIFQISFEALHGHGRRASPPAYR